MTTQTEITEQVAQLQELGASKTSASQMIKKLFVYKDYKDMIDEALTVAYGDTSTTTVDWATRVRVIRDNIDLPKKEILEKLLEFEDKKASLVQMLGYIEMCKEWARQELES